MNSLELLYAVYRRPDLPLGVRMRAATAALPFERPKFAVTAHVDGEALGEAFERAIARSGKVIEARVIKAALDAVPDQAMPTVAEGKIRRL